MRGEHPYYLAPKNLGKPLKKVANAQVWYGGKEEDFQPAFNLQNFNAKVGFETLLIRPDNGDTLYPFYDEGKHSESPFISESQIGIEKARDGKTREQAFYKQSFYRLNKGWFFSFYLEVDKNTSIPSKSPSALWRGEMSLLLGSRENRQAQH